MPQIALRDADGTLAMLRDSVAAFARQNPGPERLRGQRRSQGMDRRLWSEIAKAGWIGLMMPETAGGAGLSIREQVVVSEALGRGLAPEPYATLAVFAAALLAHAPASAERDRLAEGLIAGTLVATVAWQDPRDGGETIAEATAEGWRITGAKRLVEGAADASDFLVVAHDDQGFGLYALPRSAPGIALSFRPGVDGGALADITFSDTPAGATQRLAQAPTLEGLIGRAIAETRLAIAAELAGIAAKALELTVDYTRERVQFGKPIASFQAIQHRLVDMWMQAELASAAVRNAVEQHDGGVGAGIAVFAAKARAGDAAAMVCRNAIHLFGAMGYTDECDIGLYLKRAINLGAMLGNADAMRRLFIQSETNNRH
jgi:alkylation response protein AidB-like acyl-CoA dehydrogenase